MKAFIVGGTGLIGYHVSRELLARGHEVKSLGLTPPPKGDIFAKQVDYTQGNIEQMSDHELIDLIKGSNWLLYACSSNALDIVKAPAIDYFRVHNVFPTERILRLAQDAGVKKVVMISNAYVYFNSIMADLRLEKWHPFIRATYDQENAARRFNTTSFQVTVLQAPQIWGTMPVRRPLHCDEILEMYRTSNYSAFRGTIPVITIKQVAQAVCGAFEKLPRGETIAIAGDNYSYKRINELICQGLNMKPYVPYVKNFWYKLNKKRQMKVWRKSGLEAGINPVKILEFKTRNAHIDPKIAYKKLGVLPDDIDTAIRTSATRSIEFAKEHKEI